MSENQDTPSDAQLIKAFSGGDESAFELLYTRYRKLLYGYLNNMMPGNSCEADEVFEETWLRVIDKLPKYRDDGKFSAWLFRVARNIFIDRIRKNKQERFLALDSENFPELPDRDYKAPDAESDAADIGETIRGAVAALPPEQREVFLMRETGLSFKEIAALQGCSLNTALSRMQYALKSLRKFLSGIDNGGLIK